MDEEDIRVIMGLFDGIGDKLIKQSKITLKIYQKLTIAEANAIYAIGIEEPKTMKQLAETLDVAVSTPTRTVDRLVEKGYANRTVGTKDRRQVLIELTPKGKKLFVEMDEEGLEIIKKMLINLQDEEIEAFKNILLKVRDSME
ncbi:MAG: MarR family transcriptional regulator [Methanobacterium sp.]|uniref:MarR family winged helix-turn-helix transcriptional regulator n=1 Tax=Methanobacterium sp. TaxID=2164 RepID=UPI003D6479A2|nr:MarR family transcriptional regulator [Methanobacterium sp.]